MNLGDSYCHVENVKALDDHSSTQGKDLLNVGIILNNFKNNIDSRKLHFLDVDLLAAASIDCTVDHFRITSRMATVKGNNETIAFWTTIDVE